MSPHEEWPDSRLDDLAHEVRSQREEVRSEHTAIWAELRQLNRQVLGGFAAVDRKSEEVRREAEEKAEANRKEARADRRTILISIVAGAATLLAALISSGHPHL